MTRARQAWIDGAFHEGAGVSPYDLGVQQGIGVFETIGWFGGRAPLWGRHVERLARSAAALGIPCSPPTDLQDAGVELVARNAGDDVLRITLTAGPPGASPSWCLTTRARSGDEPVQLTFDPVPRAAEDPLAAIKCTSYAAHHLARRRAAEVGATDAIFVDTRGRALETTTANLFVVDGDRIRTPSTEAPLLAGVGRAVVVEGLRAAGVGVEEVDIPVAEVRAADGIFVTNAVHGPRVAALVGGEREPQPVPPAVLAAVLAAWRAAIA